MVGFRDDMSPKVGLTPGTKAWDFEQALQGAMADYGASERTRFQVRVLTLQACGMALENLHVEVTPDHVREFALSAMKLISEPTGSSA